MFFFVNCSQLIVSGCTKTRGGENLLELGPRKLGAVSENRADPEIKLSNFPRRKRIFPGPLNGTGIVTYIYPHQNYSVL